MFLENYIPTLIILATNVIKDKLKAKASRLRVNLFSVSNFGRFQVLESFIPFLFWLNFFLFLFWSYAYSNYSWNIPGTCILYFMLYYSLLIICKCLEHSHHEFLSYSILPSQKIILSIIQYYITIYPAFQLLFYHTTHLNNKK